MNKKRDITQVLATKRSEQQIAEDAKKIKLLMQEIDSLQEHLALNMNADNLKKLEFLDNYNKMLSQYSIANASLSNDQTFTLDEVFNKFKTVIEGFKKDNKLYIPPEISNEMVKQQASLLEDFKELFASSITKTLRISNSYQNDLKKTLQLSNQQAQDIALIAADLNNMQSFVGNLINDIKKNTTAYKEGIIALQQEVMEQNAVVLILNKAIKDELNGMDKNKRDLYELGFHFLSTAVGIIQDIVYSTKSSVYASDPLSPIEAYEAKFQEKWHEKLMPGVISQRDKLGHPFKEFCKQFSLGYLKQFKDAVQNLNKSEFEFDNVELASDILNFQLINFKIKTVRMDITEAVYIKFKTSLSEKIESYVRYGKGAYDDSTQTLEAYVDATMKDQEFKNIVEAILSSVMGPRFLTEYAKAPFLMTFLRIKANFDNIQNTLNVVNSNKAGVSSVVIKEIARFTQIVSAQENTPLNIFLGMVPRMFLSTPSDEEFSLKVVNNRYKFNSFTYFQMYGSVNFTEENLQKHINFAPYIDRIVKYENGSSNFNKTLFTYISRKTSFTEGSGEITNSYDAGLQFVMRLMYLNLRAMVTKKMQEITIHVEAIITSNNAAEFNLLRRFYEKEISAVNTVMNKCRSFSGKANGGGFSFQDLFNLYAAANRNIVLTTGSLDQTIHALDDEFDNFQPVFQNVVNSRGGFATTGKALPGAKFEEDSETIEIRRIFQCILVLIAASMVTKNVTSGIEDSDKMLIELQKYDFSDYCASVVALAVSFAFDFQWLWMIGLVARAIWKETEVKETKVQKIKKVATKQNVLPFLAVNGMMLGIMLCSQALPGDRNVFPIDIPKDTITTNLNLARCLKDQSDLLDIIKKEEYRTASLEDNRISDLLLVMQKYNVADRLLKQDLHRICCYNITNSANLEAMTKEIKGKQIMIQLNMVGKIMLYSDFARVANKLFYTAKIKMPTQRYDIFKNKFIVIEAPTKSEYGVMDDLKRYYFTKGSGYQANVSLFIILAVEMAYTYTVRIPVLTNLDVMAVLAKENMFVSNGVPLATQLDTPPVLRYLGYDTFSPYRISFEENNNFESAETNPSRLGKPTDSTKPVNKHYPLARNRGGMVFNPMKLAYVSGVQVLKFTQHYTSSIPPLPSVKVKIPEQWGTIVPALPDFYGLGSLMPNMGISDYLPSTELLPSIEVDIHDSWYNVLNSTASAFVYDFDVDGRDNPDREQFFIRRITDNAQYFATEAVLKMKILIETQLKNTLELSTNTYSEVSTAITGVLGILGFNFLSSVAKIPLYLLVRRNYEIARAQTRQINYLAQESAKMVINSPAFTNSLRNLLKPSFDVLWNPMTIFYLVAGDNGWLLYCAYALGSFVFLIAPADKNYKDENFDARGIVKMKSLGLIKS